jgi:hypothetical protein
MEQIELPAPLLLTPREIKLCCLSLSLLGPWLGKEYGEFAEEECVRLLELLQARLVEAS